MSQSTSTCRLITLPADIQKLIVTALSVPSPLFTPTYGVQDNKFSSYGRLIKKREEYYGKQNDEETTCSIALLNWSSTCRFYRDLLASHLFRDVVLRSKTKSMSSIEAISKTTHWQHIESLTVCGTYVTEERTPHPYPRDANQVDPLADFDFSVLSLILSDLPPNLKHLTLDFPTDWTRESDYLSVLDVDERLEETLEYESLDTWRKLLFTVFHAVVKNDISSKKKFGLKLLNIPPMQCSVWFSDEFEQFLGHVTEFALCLDHFDNGAGWNMNTMESPVIFAGRLYQWFWENLTNVRSLNIHADESWPIGLAPGRCHIPLALPSDDYRFQKLVNLSLKWWLMDAELITLLGKHMPNLGRLTITNYYADAKDNSSSEADISPSWADFFTALGQHPSLTQITLYPHLSGLRLLDAFDRMKGELANNEDDDVRAAWDEASLLQASRQSMLETGKWTSKDDARMKRLWPHCSLDDKYGMIFDQEEYNAERYNQGSDHTAWIRLCDVLEARGGGCEVVDVGKAGNAGWENR